MVEYTQGGDTVNSRIKELRTKHLKKRGISLTQKEMADKIGLSENYVWMIEKGDRVPSDRTISDICREFGVNRAWLETGEGEPFIPLGKKEELKAIFSDVLSGRVSDKNAFIEAVAQLPDDVFPVLVKSWIAAAEQMKEKLKDQQE